MGEIDCLCHYRHTYIPIEVKYTEHEKTLRGKLKLKNLNRLNIKSRPIIVSKNMLKYNPTT